jgi:hypothetical protein
MDIAMGSVDNEVRGKYLCIEDEDKRKEYSNFDDES